MEWHRGYGRRCLRDALERGDSPIAPHLLWDTEDGSVLDDLRALHRAFGLAVAGVWYDRGVVECCVVYTDAGVSPGMALGIARATAAGIPVEYRALENFSIGPPDA